jgi:hypothetical protein
MSGSGEVIELVLSWFVTNALTFLIVIADERRMKDEMLERAWPPSSRDSAIVVFGVLALPVHFMKTRGHLGSLRGLLGFPLGLVLGVVAIVVIAYVDGFLLESIF